MAHKSITHRSDNPKMGTPKGYADGGMVLPASQQNGGALVKAAKRIGLRADNPTLSRMAAFVSQGYPVDRAAQMVSTQNQGRGFALGGLVDVSDNADRPATKGKPISVGTDPNIKQKPIRAGRLFS